MVRHTFIIFGLFTTPNLCPPPPDTKSWRRHCTYLLIYFTYLLIYFTYLLTHLWLSCVQGFVSHSGVDLICRKIWGSESVRSSHQTVSHYSLRQWFSNTQQSRFMTVCRRLEMLVLPFIFDTSLPSFMMWNLQSYPTTVLNERMWHFRWIKTYSDLSYIFSVGQDLPPSQDTCWCRRECRCPVSGDWCRSMVSSKFEPSAARRSEEHTSELQSR